MERTDNQIPHFFHQTAVEYVFYSPAFTDSFKLCRSLICDIPLSDDYGYRAIRHNGVD
ncbi:Uncharacterised protein [Klebsiella pneumoniae]|nr:Uncharacterised protein [Klebsiella quasipneumoniae]SVW27618.1 Uncharacterised protein [Klebsiella pneumoniae]SWB19629.1 Uncharacterised protein [Klebsiella pneumoniae]SWS95004.1 Uncharacterised protein [Klebsiella pneumoniae]SYJ11614.1 Uncharacterised protein [Klebsiella pneumoniae]